MRPFRTALAASLVASSVALLPGLPSYAGAAAERPEPAGRSAAARALQKPRHAPSQRLVVGYHAAAPATGRTRALQRAGATAVTRARRGNAVLVNVPGKLAEARAALLADPAVRYVERESVYRASAESVGPERVELGVTAALAADPTLTGSGVEVAVIDSSVDVDNIDLIGRVAGPFNHSIDDPRTNFDQPCLEPLAHTEPCAHGTAVATVLAADDGNDAGMIGIAPDATIVSYNVFQDHDWASNVAIANAIDAATLRSLTDPNRKLRVINLSLGGAYDNTPVREAIADARAAGIVVVVAAGNDGGERAQYPAGDPFTLSVGATEFRNATGKWHVTEFSNRGDVDVLAPGAGVRLWWPVSGGPPVVGTGQGTSFAAPMVAGIAAGLAQKGYVGDVARAAIVASAEPGNTGDSDPAIADGVGRADLKLSVDLAAAGTPFTALFLARGGSVARTTGRRAVEVLRVDPDPTGDNLPGTLTLSPGAGGLSGVATTVDTTTTAQAVIRTVATLAAGNPSLPDGSITAAGGTGADSTTAPLRFLDASNGPEGQPAYSGDAATVPLTYGVRSSYVRSAGLYDGGSLSMSFKYDADYDPDDNLFSTTEMLLWAPTTNGGEADAASEPWWWHDFTGSLSAGVTLTLDSGDPLCDCPPGRWKFGWVEYGWWDDGNYYLRGTFKQPAVTLSTPAVVSSSGTGIPFRATWSSTAAGPVVYEVDFSRRVKIGGVWKTQRADWLPGTTTVKSGIFGKDNLPVQVVPGTTWDVHVRAIDDLGNASKWVTKRTVIPLNDNSRGTNYAGTWKLGKSASRWLGDTHYTPSAGASLTVVSEGFRFRVVGDKCHYCGQFKVYLDGVYKGTVDTRAGGTYARQILWTSPVLSGGIKKHTLKLVVVGTRGRPTVSIDAIGVER